MDIKKKFLEKIKSGATVTGKYSDKEIETLIEMKLRGHTHTDIAIALKRVFPNVDNKVRFVFSDDRYIDTIEAIRFNIEAETRKANRRNISYWNEKLNECWKNYFLIFFLLFLHRDILNQSPFLSYFVFFDKKLFLK